MDSLFQKYINIQKFATSPEYRGYELVEPKFYDRKTFETKIVSQSYIMHTFKDTRSNNDAKNDKLIDIYLFKKDSKYVTVTAHFKKLLDSYKSTRTVILITKEPLTVYRRKTIKNYDLNIKNYLHRHFIIEINKGPLCSKHTPLSVEETKHVMISLMTHGHKLPSIFENDPQNIWIGGEVNQIIKIESISEITGKSINYRIVTPSSGKVEQSSTSISQEIEQEAVKRSKFIKKELARETDQSVSDKDELDQGEVEPSIGFEEDYADFYEEPDVEDGLDEDEASEEE